MATRYCNFNCNYCTTAYKDSGHPEVDLDFLKYVLDCLPSESLVELTGGEVGLLINLDDTFKTIYNHKNIKHITVLSNGLVRLIGTDWLDKVEYWEHLISKIFGREIIKFYPTLDLEGSDRSIVVMTEPTTKSLVENFNYFKEMGLFEPHFFYKLMNHKSRISIDNYKDNLINFYGEIKDKYFINMILSTVLKTHYNRERLSCGKYPPNSFADLETKQLGHCAVNVNQSDKWEFNKENLNKLINGELYRERDYCKTCYSFDNGKNRGPNNNRSYEQ
jgi:MoaA/NifB/PqqE/SkfB family radical SAM enzyme